MWVGMITHASVGACVHVHAHTQACIRLIPMSTHVLYSRAAYTTRCSFYSVIVFADVETCCFVCTNEGLVDASIGVLQLLQMLADGSRYQSTSICEASRACNKLQGEIVATPGWEAVGKAHP